MQCHIVKRALLSSDKIGDLLSGRCYLTRKSLDVCERYADFRFDARAFKRKYRLNVSLSPSLPLILEEHAARSSISSILVQFMFIKR